MNTIEQITNIIATISIIPVEAISRDDELSKIGIDSLRIVELIVALEDGLGIIFDDSDLDPSKLQTVTAVIELVEKYMKV